ncbi:MAG: hypothetical protein JO244_06010 [Solirubrobacterales bacterium]|nr:hypothetical protein [Solirubrobacterales bacterium]
MPDQLQQRLSANESVFREINEGIERGHWPGEEDAPVSFRCECARLGCNDLIELSPRQYERVRANPRHFIVLPGHERPEVEVVVERAPGYLVVEKLDQAAAKAEEADPRSPPETDPHSRPGPDG